MSRGWYVGPRSIIPWSPEPSTPGVFPVWTMYALLSWLDYSCCWYSWGWDCALAQHLATMSGHDYCRCIGVWGWPACWLKAHLWLLPEWVTVTLEGGSGSFSLRQQFLWMVAILTKDANWLCQGSCYRDCLPSIVGAQGCLLGWVSWVGWISRGMPEWGEQCWQGGWRVLKLAPTALEQLGWKRDQKLALHGCFSQRHFLQIPDPLAHMLKLVNIPNIWCRHFSHYLYGRCWSEWDCVQIL